MDKLFATPKSFGRFVIRCLQFSAIFATIPYAFVGIAALGTVMLNQYALQQVLLWAKLSVLIYTCWSIGGYYLHHTNNELAKYQLVPDEDIKHNVDINNNSEGPQPPEPPGSQPPP